MDELAGKTIQELQIIGFSDITRFATFGVGGVRLKAIGDIDPAETVAIREITSNKGVVSIKLHDKLRALELLGDFTGIFGEFNAAIACLRKFGINLMQDADGKWYVDNHETTDPDQSEII